MEQQDGEEERRQGKREKKKKEEKKERSEEKKKTRRVREVASDDAITVGVCKVPDDVALQVRDVQGIHDCSRSS